MKQLTLKKLIIATILSLILTGIKLYWESQSAVTWISPLDIKFWANDIAIVLAWILFFVQKKRT